MTPKEKAEEIVNTFNYLQEVGIGNTEEQLAEYMFIKAIEMSIISVDLIVDTLYNFGNIGTFYDSFYNNKVVNIEDENPNKFWLEVKNEILKL